MTNYNKIFNEFGEKLYWEGVAEGDVCTLREYFSFGGAARNYRFVALEELLTDNISLLILITGDAMRCGHDGHELLRDLPQEREFFNGSAQDGRWDCFEKYNEIVKRLKSEEGASNE